MGRKVAAQVQRTLQPDQLGLIERSRLGTGLANSGTFLRGDGKWAASTGGAPSAHATSHQSGGSDPIKLDDLAAPDDNTDLDASAAKHGLLPKLDGSATKALLGDGTWGTLSGFSFASPVIVHKGSGGAGTAWTLLNAAGAFMTISPGMSAQTANKLRATPFILARPITFDRVAVANNAGGGGAVIRVGVYENKDDDTMYPGNLIFEEEIDVSSGASMNVNTIASRTLLPGLYWLVWDTNGSHQIWSPGDIHNPLMPIADPLTQTNQQGVTVDHTYGALPDPYTAGGTYFDSATGGNPIGVFVRRA